MRLNIIILNESESLPIVTSRNVESYDLKFEANGKKGFITFKVKISDTELPIFMLNDKDEEVKEVQAKMKVENNTQTYTIPLRFKLKKKPVQPTHVTLTLSGTNSSGITGKGKETNIICK